MSGFSNIYANKDIALFLGGIRTWKQLAHQIGLLLSECAPIWVLFMVLSETLNRLPVTACKHNP